MTEQLALVDGESTDGAAPVSEEPASEEPEPADEEPAPSAPEVDDDYHDEPQPRSTRRRRPFTSRLLRS